MIARVARSMVVMALALAGTAPGSADAQSGPIKIGLLAPLTGAASALGKDMLAGTELYLDEINRQVAGRKIELIVEDTEGVTATALTKARKLVDQDHAALLTGGLLASTGYALHPFADAAKIPTTYPVMSSDDLTQRKPAKWVVRTGWNSSQSTQAFGEWVDQHRLVSSSDLDQTKFRIICCLTQELSIDRDKFFTHHSRAKISKFESR